MGHLARMQTYLSMNFDQKMLQVKMAKIVAHDPFPSTKPFITGTSFFNFKVLTNHNLPTAF